VGSGQTSFEMSQWADRNPQKGLNTSSLLSTWHRVDARNRQLGWMRYDPGDVDDHPWLSAVPTPYVRRFARNAMRVADLIAPISMHSLLRVQRTVVPTAFYHVGMAYLMREQISSPDFHWSKGEVEAVCSEALARRLNAEHMCWSHPYRHHAKGWREGNPSSAPPSCAHHTARLGLLLLEVGLAHNNPELISAGVSAARALNEYHRWREYPDGTTTVSYYPNTDDETINTCADVAALLSLVPLDRDFPKRQERLFGLVQMILNEQQADGSWTYCTARHYQEHSDKPYVDNHHSAQVLQALARIYATRSLTGTIESEICTSIRRGIGYYCNAFIRADGSSSYFPKGKRDTEIVGYTEGLAAIAWSFRSAAVSPDESLGRRLLHEAECLLKSSLRFLDSQTHDVASAQRFHMLYKIKSLRWGSGPLLEGIQYVLWMLSSLKAPEVCEAKASAR
jgi:hypothetical protein